MHDIAASATTTASDTFTQLHALISNHANPSNPSTTPSAVLAALGVPSTSIAILDHGAITSDCISSTGNDTSTVFMACSISKPTAAMAIMKLVQAGKLSLDGTVAEYLPASIVKGLAGPFPTPATLHMARGITVRQLMSHSSGLGVHGFPGYGAGTLDGLAGTIPSAASVLHGGTGVNTTQVSLQSFPSSSYAYSGGGLTVLQLIIEAVTHRPFAKVVKDLVLDPLDMTHSFYGRPEDQNPRVENYARAHWNGYTPSAPPYNIFPEEAAAGLWTTPTDLLKMVRALQRSLKTVKVTGREGQESFLPRDLAREMLTEVNSGMALCWGVSAGGFSHTGSNFPGWNCIVLGYADLADQQSESTKQQSQSSNAQSESYKQQVSSPKQQPQSPDNEPHFPEDECGICIMTNSEAGTPVYRKLVRALQYLQVWASREPSSAASNNYTAFAVPDACVPSEWEQWQGRWRESAESGNGLEFELRGGTTGHDRADEGSGGEMDGRKGEPYLRYSDCPPVRLRPAAWPRDDGAGGQERIWVVCEGLAMMLCLREEGGEKVVEVWNENAGSITVLKRV